MCGIVACRLERGATPVLLKALALLEYRGYDSVGIAVRSPDGVVQTVRSTQRIGDLVERAAVLPADAGIGIGHTRWATHGAVTEQNAHPHSDCAGRVSVVHNGIIENAEELRATLRASGHVFASDVDTEVICHLVENALRDRLDLLAAVRDATSRLRGSWAVVVLDAASGRTVAAADGSPLLVARTATGQYAASDIAAIAEWVTEFQPLHDGDIVELGPALSWLRAGESIPVPAPVPVPLRRRAAVPTGHADFMGMEIDEQPEVAARILDELRPRIADGTLWTALGIPPFARVAVLGCGTSLHAGMVVGAAFARLGGVPAGAIVASEAQGTVLEPDTLLLALSQSGETADVLHALPVAEAAGASVVSITNNPHSSLARRSDSIVDCSAGAEVGVAATKTFTAQVVTGVCLALSALAASGRLDRRRAAHLSDELARIPDLLAFALATAKETLPAIVARVSAAPGFLFLGRGAGVIYAAEGALKLKELAYRWAEPYPAGELKHGPLALVEHGTPVIVVDDGDRRMAGNIAEVRARGADVIRIGGSGADIPALGRSLLPPAEGGMDSWGPLESVVPLQLLARDLALALGRDVDKPRNLAKAVTVD